MPRISDLTCPSDAELARAVVCRSATAEVMWLDTHSEKTGGPVRGTVAVRIAEAAELERHQDSAGRPVLVEIADAWPQPVRDRIRLRLRISGLGISEPGLPLRLLLHPSAVQIKRGDELTTVGPEDFAAATQDPFASVSAELLSHLAASHPEEIELLTRLIEPRHYLYGVVSVWPLEVDRFGLTLRMEYARSYRDVRLGFPEVCRSMSELRAAMHALYAKAQQKCPGLR